MSDTIKIVLVSQAGLHQYSNTKRRMYNCRADILTNSVCTALWFPIVPNLPFLVLLQSRSSHTRKWHHCTPLSCVCVCVCVWIDCHTFPHIHTIAYLYLWSVVQKYLGGASMGTENVISLLLVMVNKQELLILMWKHIYFAMKFSYF
jgi:hypothetical protein